MVYMLKNKNNINTVKIHPVAQSIFKVIDKLDDVFYVQDSNDKLSELLNEFLLKKVRLNGVLDEDKNLLVFSPLFDLLIPHDDLPEYLNNNTIIYDKNELSALEIEDKIWGEFFKNIFLSLGRYDANNIIKLLKIHLPSDERQRFFD